MKNAIDINCDMGELLLGQSTNQDVLFMPFISSANISCGAHSGSKEVIENTVRHAAANNLRIGAHPSYPDRNNFGRVSMDLSKTELHDSLSSQLEFINTIVTNHGGQITYVKPHGALYNDITHNEKKASHFLDTIKRINPNLKIMGLAESSLKKWTIQSGMQFISEAFADRRYTSQLTLKSRTFSDALIVTEDQLIKQLSHLIINEIIDDQSEKHDIEFESICFHSDTPNALELLKTAHDFLINNNISIASD